VSQEEQAKKQSVGSIASSRIAIPYAKAAFEYAEQNKKLTTWSKALQALAEMLVEPAVRTLWKNPKTDKVVLEEALLDEIKKTFADEGLENFIHVLMQNKRLLMLPDIFQKFEKYRERHEKTVPVQLISVDPISPEQQEKLATALKIRLQRQVVLQFEQDPSLLGGAIIRVGDLVIDGSVQNTLSRMLSGLLRP
jgi:F-type H+-transporting ATPase subunit delta